MAVEMLSSKWPDNYELLLESALDRAHGWPPGLRFRMTESNSFSGGRDAPSQNFGSALWALDYFHWWAARGCAGVDPFTRVVQDNAPIFQVPGTGEFRAEPYAYAMLAFGRGSKGTAVDPTGLAFSAPYDWLTAYAVVDSAHLYVTLIDKTFNFVGSKDAMTTIRASGFVPTHARYLVLASAPGASGDASARSARLGGTEIPNDAPWTGTWQSTDVHADGTVGPIKVEATTAIIVDITSD
jgi:hypothetical protein